MSQRVTTLCVCVCVSKFIFMCVWAHYYSPCAAICLITFQSPLYCMSGWHTTHTQTHTPPKSVYRFLFFLAPPSSPPSSFFFYISRQLTFFSTLLVSVQAYSLAFMASPLYLPPSPFLTEKKKKFLSPSGKKSGCIRVMRKFKSLKEDCTVACTKLIFSQCERVCSCVRVYVCGFYSSTHAFTYSLLRNVCLYLPSCQCVFRSSPSCFIFYFLFHFLSVSLLKVKSQL